jgi:hypothetical protein
MNPAGTIVGNIINNSSGVMQGSQGIFMYPSALISGSIQNAGTIKGTLGAAFHLTGASISQGITNTGLIQAPANQRAIELTHGSTLTGGLNNTGTISASGTSGYAIYIDAGSTVTQSVGRAILSEAGGAITGNVFNAGTISSAASTGIQIRTQTSPMGGFANTGTISALREAVYFSNTSLTGNISNSKSIAGGADAAGGLHLWVANVAGRIENIHPGVISASGNAGGNTGLYLESSIVTGGVTNSGTISATGSRASLKVFNPGSGSGGIVVSGSNTAKFIGPVQATGVPMTVANGATYTADNGNRFTVSGFTTDGTLGVAAGGTATVTGNYTQNSNGTFLVNATDASTYGKLTVTGTATLLSAAKFELVTGNATTCGGITAGGTIAGVLKSGGAMTSSTFAAVTDDCDSLVFTAQYNSATSAIDLVASTANTAPSFVGSTNTFTLAQGASATDMRGYLVASETDPSQTLTWTQSSGPNQGGALSVSGATASSGSGSASITSSGTISYTPVATFVGTESFVVQVSDGTGSALRTLTGTIGSARTVTVNALTLNSMTAGTSFVSQTFTGSGGYGAYVCDISAGALPTGLALSSGCVLSGTPTTAASYNFTVRVRDSSTGTGPFAGTLPYSSVTVAPANAAPTYVGATTTLTVAHGAAATDVKALLHASDSNASQTLTWTQTTGPTHGTLSGLPATASTGLSGSSDITPGGTITYQPTAGYAGADSFTVQVSDGTANASRTINVTISPPTVTVSALTLNTMTVGTAYTSQTFAATGGTAPYTYTVSAGALPAGLSLNANTGALTGTPTTAGAYSFTIQATDSTTGTHGTGTRAFSGAVLGSTSRDNIQTSNAAVTANLAVAGCSGVTSAVFVAAPNGAPANTAFPYGLLDFTLNGCSGSAVTVTVTYSQPIPSGALFYKAVNGVYSQYNYLNATTIGSNSVKFTLVDGGSGDDDGAANGSIHDPSGLGFAASAESIPTLSEWGLISLTGLMGLFGLRQMRRRKPTI